MATAQAACGSGRGAGWAAGGCQPMPRPLAGGAGRAQALPPAARPHHVEVSGTARLRCRASAATSTSTALSVPSVLPRPCHAQRLLEACLPDVVRAVGRGPALLLANDAPAPSRELVPLPGDVTSSEEVWRRYSTLLREREPAMYIYVHEVPPTGSDCAAAATVVDPAAAAAPWCASARRGGECCPLEGRLGECCDDGHGAGHAHAAGAPAPVAAACRAADTRYWGLVVRTAAGSAVDGCYLLHTVQNRDATGCTCTHFSAHKVCAGQNLQQQLVRSWLV